jgi:hypothetical protein
MKQSMHKAINYDRLRDTTQEKEEKANLFLGQITEALRKYTNMSLDSVGRQTLLGMSFISQLPSDIHHKLQKQKMGFQTPLKKLVDLTFLVFNN